MPAIQKIFTAKVTAAADPAATGDAPGTFEALVSVFGNTDSYGDIVQAGAFTQSLKDWAAKGRPIPVVWSHQMGDPDNILGKYVEAEETPEGLRMKGVMDLDHPRAARVHQLMLDGLIAEFSFSGEVRDFDFIEDDDEDSWWPGLSIKDVDLWEAGPCFKGANPDTQLISIKSADYTGPLAKRIRAQSPVKEATTEGQTSEVYALQGPTPVRVEEPAADITPPIVQRASAATPKLRALLELITLK